MFSEPAFGKAADEFVRNAQPGDTWYFRVLDNRSNSDRAAVMPITCPEPLAASNNEFDVNTRRAYDAAMRGKCNVLRSQSQGSGSAGWSACYPRWDD